MAQEKSWVEDLERLAELHRKKGLTDKEFAKAKAKLLALNPEEIGRRSALEQQAAEDFRASREAGEIKRMYYRGCLGLLVASIMVSIAVTWCGSGP